jgi:hypothetical protein
MRMTVCCRWLVAIASAIGLTFNSMIPAHAEPDPDNPYPDMKLVAAWYNPLAAEEFFIPEARGVWFVSPSGLNCGIWTWGSFGCAGAIPGAPPGIDRIAWYNGNRAVHYGWTAAIGFPAGQAQRPLPPNSYVTYESTTCVVTTENNLYCEHGEFKFFMTPTATWFKGWDDRLSYVCLSYGTCPPG